MSESPANLNQLLREIERELQAIDLWSRQQPGSHAINSMMPFCHDTLPFEQWIQWVMIPSFDKFLQNATPLPSRCDVAPMAEIAFAQITAKTDQLLALLHQLDSLINKQNALMH